ncbi:MAG: succinyldiaminopimelate transaminase [Pseudomonadota bacterium]
MQTNPGFATLHPYPFEKLAQLLGGVTPPDDLDPIPLAIGEPRHAPPEFVLQRYRDTLLEGVSRYPSMRGGLALREACAGWLQRRFNVRIDPANALHPVTGTREALFAITQTLVDPAAQSLILMPNPFYQIYEGAALLAGATPHYLAADHSNGYLPDLDAIAPQIWHQARVFYLCNPVNPAGTVAPVDYLRRLIALAREHDVVVVADECYIELYRDQPPDSVLNAAHDDQHTNVLAFHSLSKRSNLPGLRSGFVAGDPALIELFARYRTYHGCSMSLAVQHASAAAWDDDAHVMDNRAQYNAKYVIAQETLGRLLELEVPAATFYLWPSIGEDDTTFCRDLFEQTHITAVPGQYLARTVNEHNPGFGHIRLSLVADLEHTRLAFERIAAFIQHRRR